MDYSIVLEGVCNSFNVETVLRNIHRKFESGKIHGIIGNNGSGKTVLMKCMCGFLLPDCGRVFVNNIEVGNDVDFPDDLGIIIETPGFLANKSGFENLLLLAALRKRISKGDVCNAMKQVGLDPAMKKSVSKYSLGMRQRLGIAQAIMENPNILILDEPFNGLDKLAVAKMRNIIKSLRDNGKTVILSSHNQDDIDELCDTVCEVDGGEMRLL